ncbi:MAG TPA: CocE/NonD family hydrolase [Gaiellaceae bacterium]|nr:CocE/NonD family hydrolase [Gaiellaceae bacterium]
MTTLSRQHTVIAGLGIGVLALHVLDDSFIQPQPGTSAGDHLAGGLVPLALIALAAVLYPRVRAGARGTLAILLGLLALIMGTAEAGYYTLKVGPSGDDYTGLLTIPAGLVLVGLGGWTLWKTRKLDDSRVRRYVRRALIAAAALVVAWSVMFPIALGYGTTHILRPIVPAENLGAAHEDVTFKTSDGLELSGWYIPSRNGAAVIVYPGRSGSQKPARVLARHGYGVLLFDRRGEGESDGDGNLFGWGGDKDIIAAAKFLKSRPDVDPERIGGVGLSVGAELMLQTASETDDLAAVVSEGAGTRWFAEEMDEFHGVNKWLGVPMLAMKTASVAVFSNTAPPPKLTDLAPRIHEPLFVIYASDGGVETMSPKYYRLAQGPKTIWGIPGVEHMGGFDAHPKEYERRVVGFFDRALSGSAAGEGLR